MAFGGLLENIDIHHEFADFLFEALDLVIFLGLVIERTAAKCIFGSSKEAVFPFLDVGDGQAMFARGFRRRCVTTQDV